MVRGWSDPAPRDPGEGLFPGLDRVSTLSGQSEEVTGETMARSPARPPTRHRRVRPPPRSPRTAGPGFGLAGGRKSRVGRTSKSPEEYSLYRVVAPLSKDGWGYHFSRAHPSLRFELLDRIEVGEDLLLAEIRMMGPGAYDWPAESRAFPNVIHIETLPEGPQSVLYRVTYKAPFIHTVTRRHHVLTRYPIIVQNGQSQFETFAGNAQMRDYLEELRRRVGPSHVESVQRGSVTTQTLGLTPGQAGIFQEAVTSGFFQVPRRITLTGLAERLGRSKSTVSTALVRIRKKLAESALQLDLTAFRTAP